MFAPKQSHGWTHECRAGGACTVELVTDPAAFVDLERAWNETVARAGITHPFLRHEWVRTWWDAFGGGCRLHILLVRADGRIVAIAPLLRESVQMYGVPVRRIRLMHNDHTPRADFIVAERAADAYGAIWRTLWAGADEWDVLQLGQLPRTSATREYISRLALETDCATGIWHSGDSPCLELGGTWEEYYNSLSPKFRQNLRNRLSRLRRIGEPSLEMLSDAASIRRACDDAWRLEASGWKRESGTAISSDRAVHRFYTTLVDRATGHGWLRLMFLTVAGRRVATAYGARFANRLFLFKTGYDPEYAACSPFKLLTYFAVRHACEEGLAEVDFLGDPEPWKLEWTRTTRGHDWLYVFSKTRRARLVHAIKFQWGPELKRWRA